MSSDNIQGNINISNDFLAICIANCVKSIDGVIDVDDGLQANLSLNMLKRDGKSNKGVKLYRKNDYISVDLYIIVSYGTQIPQLAWQIQRSVSGYIKKIIGINTEEINVHVQGVRI
ncbi:MAG: Asp23/Gls24 family envelope stress response protein [Eubacterium sp.]|nr:Asp23/Gls24 family envelope stress response protein [Eubacterium sp.]